MHVYYCAETSDTCFISIGVVFHKCFYYNKMEDMYCGVFRIIYFSIHLSVQTTER